MLEEKKHAEEIISGFTRYELDDCINTVKPQKWVLPWTCIPHPASQENKPWNEASRTKATVSEVRHWGVKYFHPPSINSHSDHFLRKRCPMTFLFLETGDVAMSTCHTVYFNKSELCFPLPSASDWQYIIIQLSKRCWTEFSLSKMSRFVFVTREHSWSTPAALWLIQMEQVTYT